MNAALQLIKHDKIAIIEYLSIVKSIAAKIRGEIFMVLVEQC